MNSFPTNAAGSSFGVFQQPPFMALPTQQHQLVPPPPPHALNIAPYMPLLLSIQNSTRFPKFGVSPPTDTRPPPQPWRTIPFVLDVVTKRATGHILNKDLVTERKFEHGTLEIVHGFRYVCEYDSADFAFYKGHRTPEIKDIELILRRTNSNRGAGHTSVNRSVYNRSHEVVVVQPSFNMDADPIPFLTVVEFCLLCFKSGPPEPELSTTLSNPNAKPKSPPGHFDFDFFCKNVGPLSARPPPRAPGWSHQKWSPLAKGWEQLPKRQPAADPSVDLKDGWLLQYLFLFVVVVVMETYRMSRS